MGSMRSTGEEGDDWASDTRSRPVCWAVVVTCEVRPAQPAADSLCCDPKPQVRELRAGKGGHVRSHSAPGKFGG